MDNEELEELLRDWSTAFDSMAESLESIAGSLRRQEYRAARQAANDSDLDIWSPEVDG